MAFVAKIMLLLVAVFMNAPTAIASPMLYRDIAYGSYPLQKLDVYVPESVNKNKSLPVLVFIHGGAWKVGDKKNHSEKGAFYVSRDIVFVSVNYRLAPQDMHPAQARDVASSLKWVADNIAAYGGDRNNIHLSGHSAGAHIAALVATDPQYLETEQLTLDVIKSVFPVDTASFDLTSKMELGARFIGRAIKQSFGTEKETLEQASPIYQIIKYPERNYPKFVVFVTSRRPEAVRQTAELSNALKKAGAKSEYYIIKNVSHKEMGSAIANEGSSISEKMLSIINQEK